MLADEAVKDIILEVRHCEWRFDASPEERAAHPRNFKTIGQKLAKKEAKMREEQYARWLMKQANKVK